MVPPEVVQILKEREFFGSLKLLLRAQSSD
jgi:hypothetical protein